MFLNKKISRILFYALAALFLLPIYFIFKDENDETSSTSNSVFNMMPMSMRDNSFNEKNMKEDPFVLVDLVFESCTSFAFFESCSDNINNIYKELIEITGDDKIIQSLQVNKIEKDLYARTSYFTSLYSYEIKLSFDIASRSSIPAIDKFYIFNNEEYENERDESAKGLNKNFGKSKKLPFEIFVEADGVTDLSTLKSMGYIYAGYGLWYKKSTSYRDSLSSVNFFFGIGFSRYTSGWSLVNPYPLMINVKNKIPMGFRINFNDYRKKDLHKYDKEVFVYFKRQRRPSIPQVKLTTDDHGKFKIVQLADLHLSTGYGKCLDPFPPLDYPIKNCLADELTLDFVANVLVLEKPDLVVLTGDQIYGEESFDSETALLKILNLIIRFRIPYALVFGNHDDELASMSRQQLMDMVEKLPYSVSHSGPEDVSGVGNYEVVVEDVNGNNSIIIYMLDSHARAPGKAVGYDWFKDDQKEFISNLSNAHADTPNAIKLAFFHIPLFEYRNIDKSEKGSYQGTHRESVTSSNINSGMFHVLKSAGVRLVSVGHDHCNDFCFTNEDVHLCYGGGAGFGGYAGYPGFYRTIRVFSINTSNGHISTWKRLSIDPHNIVDPFTYLN